MNQRAILDLIESKQAHVAVIGLGFVGVPVACKFAGAGFHVTGIDIVPEKVDRINAGLSPIESREPGLQELLSEVVDSGRLRATADYGACRDAQVILIAVETPIDDATKQPNYGALRSVLTALGPHLQPDTLVIIESTLAPGTMQGLVTPLLEETSGLQVHTTDHCSIDRRSGRSPDRASATFMPHGAPPGHGDWSPNTDHLYLVHCPERVMPGRLLTNLATMSRVVGGVSPEAAELAVALYRHSVQADLDVTDALTAELVKTAENAYRDVQIAFANEMALLCEGLGADVWRVRELVNKSPGRNMLLPGAGVGGHCIPKDPWLLIANGGGGFRPQLIPAARSVNDGMPLHVAQLVARALAAEGIELAEARIAVLGYAYLENSDDARNSPSAVLVGHLRSLGAEVPIHDPWIPAYNGDLHRTVADSDALVLMVAHDAYRNLDLVELRRVMRTPVLIDGRKVFTRDQAEAAGFRFYSVGVG